MEVKDGVNGVLEGLVWPKGAKVCCSLHVCMSGRHKGENKTSERPGEKIAASVQGLSWKMESKRTRLHQSKINGNFSFLFFFFAWRKWEIKPNVLFWVSPNCILNVTFCFEVSCPSCFSHFLLFHVSFEWKMPL